MARDIKHISILDDDSAPHEYAIRKHGAIEGGALFARILPIVGKTIDAARKTLAPAMVDVVSATRQGVNSAAEGKPASEEPSLSMSDVLDDPERFKDALDAMLGATPAALEALASILGDEALLRDIFKYTTRDGAALSGSHAFNVAFDDNMGELITAARHIVWHNFHKSIKRLLGKSGAARVSQVAAKMQDAAPGWLRAHAH